MQQPIRATVKVGFLTLIALLILISTVIWLRGRWVAGGDHYDVHFSDVDGMRAGAPVQYMGLRVGFVDEVIPTVLNKERHAILVKFTVSEPGLSIPKGSSLSIQQSGLIGEKYLEIMPPRLRDYMLRLEKEEAGLHIGTPIKVRFEDGLMVVGAIRKISVEKNIEVLAPKLPYQYRIAYWVTEPGYAHPIKYSLRYVNAGADNQYLLLSDPISLISKQPQKDTFFAVEDPLRLKTFLEKQLISAEALQETNDKINKLLSEETIASIQGTLKNTELLTQKTNQVLNHADTLFTSASKDLHTLVASADSLSSGVTSLTKNLNEIAADPTLKKDLIATVGNIKQSSQSLNKLLESEDLQVLLAEGRVSAENASAILQELRQTVVEEQLPERVSESVDKLNSSLTHLSSILSQVDSEDAGIQKMIQDTKETSGNLKKFSQKLNKHFLLLRLLF